MDPIDPAAGNVEAGIGAMHGMAKLLSRPNSKTLAKGAKEDMVCRSLVD